jgi:hypothetical protein
MNTEIEYLKLLERDLEDAAVREVSRGADPAATPAPRRRPGRTWGGGGGGAPAAFLVVAAAIGFVAGGNTAMFSGADGAGSGGAPQMAPTDARRAVGGLEDELAVEPGAAVPNTAPAPEEQSNNLFGDEPLFGDDLAGGQTAGRDRQQLRDLSKIIRDGRISVVVGDGTFAENEDELTSIAELNGGFVLSSSTERERSGTFVLRIPAKRFDRALAQIRGLGEVRSQQVTGEDVTAEFIDFQARLRLLEERRALLSRLSEEATTTDEILRFARLIDDVQLRIEQMQGQIRFINDQVAEATLRVTIAERNAPHTEPPPDIENPNLGSSFDLAVQGFLRIVGAVIVGLGYLIPLTILAGLIWLVVTALRRQRER